MAKSFNEWLNEGEQLYDAALAEYRTLEQQIGELERQLAVKQQEVNQMASIIGKEPVEASRRLSAQIVEPNRNDNSPNSAAAIARAISGRGLGR